MPQEKRASIKVPLTALLIGFIVCTLAVSGLLFILNGFKIHVLIVTILFSGLMIGTITFLIALPIALTYHYLNLRRKIYYALSPLIGVILFILIFNPPLKLIQIISLAFNGNDYELNQGGLIKFIILFGYVYSFLLWRGYEKHVCKNQSIP
jgi:hypothetical protein